MHFSEPHCLVNCHTHLELGWARYLCPDSPGVQFTSWYQQLSVLRKSIRRNGDEATFIQSAVEEGIAELMQSGTTHLGDITKTGLSLEPLLDSGLAGTVYLEVIGRDEPRGMAKLEWAKSVIEIFRPHERHGMRVGLAPHSLYTTHPAVIRSATEYCIRECVPLCIHVCESPYENEKLVFGTGPLNDLDEMSVSPPLPPVGVTGITHLRDLGVLDAQPLLVHAVHVSTQELNWIADSGAKIAHCPRSNDLLQCGLMRLSTMLDLGIQVGLGTDSLASSPSLNVLDEAEFAIRHHQEVTTAQIRDMLQNPGVLL